jgi:hypothetical protein
MRAAGSAFGKAQGAFPDIMIARTERGKNCQGNRLWLCRGQRLGCLFSPAGRRWPEGQMRGFSCANFARRAPSSPRHARHFSRGEKRARAARARFQRSILICDCPVKTAALRNSQHRFSKFDTSFGRGRRRGLCLSPCGRGRNFIGLAVASGNSPTNATAARNC